MAIKLDGNGDVVLNPSTGLSVQVSGRASLEQDAMSECRCEQQGWFADDTYGRNPLVWKLPTSNNDKVADIKRIVTKYYQPQSIAYSGGYFVVS
jgi:hypothetical protein